MERGAQKVRWGILSTGHITHRFVQDFAFVPNGEVVAVASRSQEVADAFAARYGIPRAYAGYQRLLDDPQVDAVYVATPHTLHFRNTADAIEAGKHILCEKPFTVGARESRSLFRLAEQSSVFIMEAMWTWKTISPSRISGAPASMPWSVTVRIQEHMDRVRKLYSER